MQLRDCACHLGGGAGNLVNAVTISRGIDSANLAIVYAHPAMARTGHDFRPPAPVFSPNATYFSIFDGGSFAGAALTIKSSSHEVEVHSLIFPEFARISRDVWRFISRTILGDGQTQRLTANIPEDLPTIRNLAKRVGFRDEGFKRNAIRRNGRWIGVYILGMTAEEII